MADADAVKYIKKVPSTTYLRFVSMKSLWKFETFIRGMQMELVTETRILIQKY